MRFSGESMKGNPRAIYPLLLLALACWACDQCGSTASTDAGPGEDAGSVDAGDAGTTDAGPDAGPGMDAGPTGAAVLQHHNHLNRDGVFIDPAITWASLATMHRDPNFTATVDGQVFAQPLFLENGPSGKDTLFVVTENDQVSAFDATSGAVLWRVSLGTPSPRSELQCGNIDPLGITGTPVIDVASRTIFLDAMILPDGGSPHHNVFGLSVDDGSTRWSFDVDATVAGFSSAIQSERGALTILGGTLYLPYGGYYGDCGNYHAWVVGVSLANPTTVTSWATPGRESGAWGPSGIASDGTSMFVSTGNGATSGPNGAWSDSMGEAVLRIGTGPTWGGQTQDYYAPTDWKAHDDDDSDLGSSGVVLFDAPGATPRHLAFAIGKTTAADLLDTTNLGGLGGEVARIDSASSNEVFGAMAAYTTPSSTYVAFLGENALCGSGGNLSTLSVSATSPPQLAVAWCAPQGGKGSPIVTSRDGTRDWLVWGLGASGDGKLRAFDADTGALKYTSTAMSNLEQWISPIVAKGRIYVAGSGTVTAFTP
jgi:outer membrane protein assembly factor BamB